jgi:uncharacterized protein YbjT (DUF2867 family)
MILVTGAAGKTGRAVLAALDSRGATARGLVRTREQIGEVERIGAVEGIVADLASVDEMRRAFEGIRTVYLIVPNMHPEERRIGEMAIEAARASEVQGIVYHSVLHPQTRQMPHHWQKLEVEEKLFESGLGFTILQPAAYMQNLVPYWDEIVEEGVYRVPYGEHAALSLVDLEDVAEAAAAVLTSEGHAGATYELAGPEALSPKTMAAILSSVLGTEVTSETIPLEIWAEKARAKGLEGYPLDSLLAMFRYYDRHGLVGNPRVLESLLGRPASTFRRFVARRVLR